MLIDLLKQAYEAMQYNRRRTLITVAGMAWGIATVVLLLAYGAGFSRAIMAIFSQWGINSIGVFPGTTSEQAGGKKAGVPVRFTQDDHRPALLRACPAWNRLTATLDKDSVPIQNDLHSYTWHVEGSHPAIADILNYDVVKGRFYTEQDNAERNHVAVLGSEAATKLFSGIYPIGQRIRVGGISFTVIGVLKPKMTEDENNVNREVHIPFKTMGDLKDMKYLDGIWMTYRGDHMRVEQAVRQTLGAAHGFRPTDHNAIYVANLMEQLAQFRIITAALEVLMAFIGSLTLGIAGIGLMNIMLVSVQQRTREIGVEKALGARKRHILIQFLAEALVISATGGVLGMLLAYAVSLAVGRITFYSAIAQNATDADIRLLISPLIVVVSTGILIVVGLVSGMVPALRAANLDPIEALALRVALLIASIRQ